MIDCSGAPVCGLSSNYVFIDDTITVIVFEYPSSNTTSEYTLTLSHTTTCNATVYESATTTPTGTYVYRTTIEGNSTLTLIVNPVVTVTTITETYCSY